MEPLARALRTRVEDRNLPAPAPEHPEPSDAELLLQLGARETAALATLYDRHAGYAMAIAQRILGERAEAEEVVQDVFWQLWSDPSRYDVRRGRFTSFLFTVARSRALDRLRRRGRVRRVPKPDPADAVPAGDQQGTLLDGERQRQVQAALAQLTPAQRQAIELSFYRGLTHLEIAQETGEALGTVKSRLARALSALRDALASEEGA